MIYARVLCRKGPQTAEAAQADFGGHFANTSSGMFFVALFVPPCSDVG